MASARRSIDVDVPPERFFEVVRDYSDYSGGSVQTGWVDQLRPALQRLGAQ